MYASALTMYIHTCRHPYHSGRAWDCFTLGGSLAISLISLKISQGETACKTRKLAFPLNKYYMKFVPKLSKSLIIMAVNNVSDAYWDSIMAFEQRYLVLFYVNFMLQLKEACPSPWISESLISIYEYTGKNVQAQQTKSYIYTDTIVIKHIIGSMYWLGEMT